MNIFESVGRAMTSRVVGRADEFAIELEDGWIHLKDGEGAVRISMPQEAWDRLVKSYTK